MAAIGIDTFAVTNPAFGALVLRGFAEGYAEAGAGGVPLALVLLPLPMVLTRSITDALAPTNAKTGLLPWVARVPEVTVGMADRIEATAGISRAALLFGVRYSVLGIDDLGLVVAEEAGLAKKAKFPPSSDTGKAISLAKRLGGWMGEIRSPATALLCLGVNR